MTLALSPSHDLYLGSRSSIAVVTDGEAVAQGVLTRLRLFLGEWFLDVNEGTPWYQDVLIDTPDIRVIEVDLKARILEDPRVLSLLSFDLEYDRATRGITLSFSAETIFGPTDTVSIEVTP